MQRVETIWRLMVAGLAIWRISRVFRASSIEASGTEAADREAGSGRFWVARALDLVCWITVWMSSSLAIWVTLGFAGLLASWITVPGGGGLFTWTTNRINKSQIWIPLRGRAAEKVSCLRRGEGMQVHHG